MFWRTILWVQIGRRKSVFMHDLYHSLQWRSRYVFSCDDADPGSILARKNFLNNVFNFHRTYTLWDFINFNLQRRKTYAEHQWVGSTQESTAVGQAAACAPVTQRARIRSPVGTSFLGEVFFGAFPRQMSGSFMPRRSPNIIWPS